MANNKWEVGGRFFYNRKEYEAALRDQEKINHLRSTTDFTNADSIMELYRMMQSKRNGFETVVGRDFDDEVYELVSKIKSGSFVSVQKKKGTKKKGTSSGNKQSRLKEKEDKLRKQKIEVYTKGEYAFRVIVKNMFLIAAIACLSYFGYYYYMSIKTDQEAKQLASLKENEALNSMMKNEVVVNKDTPEEKVYVLLDEYKTLYNKNKNLIGWIKIDDTIIDYPVMQASDNEYYLDHNLEREYDRNGSLFLDKECSITDRSTNLIIYGHHMKSGKMFGDLDKYKSESYFKEHPVIQFDTIYEKGTYEVMYVFNSKIYYEDEIVFKYYQFIDALSEQEFNSNMQEMQKMSLYDTGVRAEYGDELLTLSTCDYGETDARFVVVAKRVS